MFANVHDLFHDMCARRLGEILKNQRLWELLRLFYPARNLRRNLAN
jgi:hypothetical protein